MSEQTMSNEQEKARKSQLKWRRILHIYLILYLAASAVLFFHAVALLAEF